MQDVLSLHATEIRHVITENMSIIGMHDLQMLHHVAGAEQMDPTLFALNANPQVAPADMGTHLTGVTGRIVAFSRG